MSSIKRKDEIQKSVEESILDAVTKFKTDEFSFNPYESTRQLTEEDLMAENPDAQSIWNFINKSPLGVSQSQEPPALEPTTLDRTTLEPPALEPTTLDRTTLEPPALEPTALDRTTLDRTTLDRTTLDRTTLEPPSKSEPVEPESLVIESPSIEDPALELQELGGLGFDSKIFGDASRSVTVAGKPKPPVFRKSKLSAAEGDKDGSQLKTIAVGQVGSPQVPKLPPSSFDFSPNHLASLNSIQLKLYEGDHLKIAQHRIEDLEKEVDRLRLENERLASASELFQKRSEENLAIKQEFEKKLTFNEERFAEERISLKNHIEQRDAIAKELREKVEDLESRLSNDIRKSRSRERELENRLELARLEKISLVGSKDEIILDLKRQVDQLNHELGNYRRKAAEMNQTIDANQEQFRRTVRALRLALTNLEVNEQIGGRSKKAE